MHTLKPKWTEATSVSYNLLANGRSDQATIYVILWDVSSYPTMNFRNNISFIEATFMSIFTCCQVPAN